MSEEFDGQFALSHARDWAQLAADAPAVPLPLCKNCKWWLKCQDAQRMSFGHCKHVNLSHGCGEPTAASAYANYAVITTGPDFGCVHFEAST